MPHNGAALTSLTESMGTENGNEMAVGHNDRCSQGLPWQTSVKPSADHGAKFRVPVEVAYVSGGGGRTVTFHT